MKKKIFCLVLAFAALSLSACTGNPEVKNPDALTIMGKKSDLEKPYMTRIFDLYETKTGKDLEIISYEDSLYETTATEKFKKGEAPDLFMHFHNADLNRFSIEENFYYLNNESWVSDLTDSARNYCTDANGNLLGLPFWESSVSGCYYNKKLLDELGLRAATTQEEFDSLCRAIVDCGRTPICWPANGCSWMIQFGLDPLFADHPALLESINKNETSFSEIAEVNAMVKWIADAADNGWFGNDYFKIGWDEISSNINSGDAVMTFIWDTWFYTDFKPAKYSVDDFALMPVFMNTANEGTYEGGNLNMMMVNKNSEHLDEALQFLSFCATAENYNLAFEGISTVSCFKGMTTNIQSRMVTEAQKSISAHERVSTAASKIIGYSADDMTSAINELFRKKTDVEGCIRMMDGYRISEAEKQGIEGF